MKDYDFLNKTEIDTFTYSSAKENRYTCKNMMYLGRKYTKWGDEQIVTFFGIMYEVENTVKHKTEYVVLVGLSKQHPEDIHHDKKVALETARVNALMDPFMTIKNVSKNFDRTTFVNMMTNYLASMDLDFVLTADELRSKTCKCCCE